MKKSLLLIFIATIFCGSTLLPAQNPPFHKGVNLTGWFQTNSPRQIQFTRYTKKDFEQIKSLGCDVIRLPINLHFMTQGDSEYTLDPLFLKFLDEPVNWAEELGMYLLLDNHTFDPAGDTDPNVGEVLKKVWRQMAMHFKNRSEYIMYEVLNEPHGISDQLWNNIQQEVVQAIRTVDTKHTIIIGPAGWNSYSNLDLMPVYQDDNLIYTFHFYDPFAFTHQGASWSIPSMEPLSGMPFPYTTSQMPVFPSSLRGTWIEDLYNNYPNQGTIQSVKSLIDIAVKFRDTRKIKIFCGELGVYIPNSPAADRVFWYKTVRNYLEEKNIPWTSWDYHSGFGLYNAAGNDLFDHDLNVGLLQALGFNVPPQTPFLFKPDSSGFPIYTDYIEKGILESSYSNGGLDFYAEKKPNNGIYCIDWTSAQQYGIIGFDFQPNKDLSYLVQENYAISFLYRGDTPGINLDIRFLDTKTGPTDRPWRMRYTIDESVAPVDNNWHKVYIPLKNFNEQGAWDDGWFNPEGKFDWKAVDRFEIVAEYQALSGNHFAFDHIILTNQDTLKVNISTAITGILLDRNAKLQVFPNPVKEVLTFRWAEEHEMVGFELLDLNGRQLESGMFIGNKTIDVSSFPKGIYWIKVKDKKGVTETSKVLVQ